MIADIICAEVGDPVRDITIEPVGLEQVDYGFRRPGGQRNNWWKKGIEEYWRFVRQTLPQNMQYATYDQNNQEQVGYIYDAARCGIGTRQDHVP